jgi:hypothetical protein
LQVRGQIQAILGLFINHLGSIAKGMPGTLSPCPITGTKCLNPS